MEAVNHDAFLKEQSVAPVRKSRLPPPPTSPLESEAREAALRCVTLRQNNVYTCLDLANKNEHKRRVLLNQIDEGERRAREIKGDAGAALEKELEKEEEPTAAKSRKVWEKQQKKKPKTNKKKKAATPTLKPPMSVSTMTTTPSTPHPTMKTAAQMTTTARMTLRDEDDDSDDDVNYDFSHEEVIEIGDDLIPL
uniref:BCNT-C domain-containing protein n=1 Tax=Panagrellus redivivus TaxID=6233 RepID=A0A7E4UMV0_PANRE